MGINTVGNAGSNAATPLPKTASQGTAAQRPAMVSASEPKSVAQPEPKFEQLQQAMDSIRRSIEAKAPNSLEFSVDDSTGRTIVRVTDAATGEMIRQIPSEEMLEIARSLEKAQEGMLLQQQA